MSTEQTKRGWFARRLGLGVTPAAKRQKLLYGLGALTLVFLLLEALSGVYMSIFFQPTPADAWKSVEFIEESVTFGMFARSAHRWGAFLLLFLVVFHIIGVIWRGAYRAPRELNWLLGILLLILTVAFMITGYMLQWDFRSYWIVQTMNNWLDSLPLFSGFLKWVIHDGAPNGAVPVGLWFAIHAMVLPILTGVVLAGHYVLFRRHGAAGNEQGGGR